MFFAYIDESGDTGMAESPTSTFVLSYVPSAFGGATLQRNAENIVEDSSDRRSQESFFIQLADLNAYAAYRKVFPGATFGEEIWDELGSSRVLEVNSLRGGPPGIVVWPN